MYVEASSPFEAVLESGSSGLVGTIEVKIMDNDGVNVVGPSPANITEDGTSGIYIWNAPAAPGTLGQYTIVWSLDGTFNDDTVAVEDLVVVAASAGALPPIPAPAEGGLPSGPCSAWTTNEAVATCCGLEDPDILDAQVAAASELLYEASGRRFSGLCQRTVRPCRSDDCGCGYQVLSRGHLVGWTGDCWGGYHCGCRADSRVKLAGQVRAIVEVMIDGVVVDPSEYFVREQTYLVRKNGARWPSCQSTDVDDDAAGAFAVTYTYGQTPPVVGQQAARELACEIYKACIGSEDCRLPTGATRITRSGITIERQFFSVDADGVWRTGLPLVDLFLNRYNPHGLPRRATFWSASSRVRYARPS